jgi:DNA-3-methyladenine glycosylase II
MTGLEGNNLAVAASRPLPLRKIVFQIKPAPPFRLDLTVWALRRRPHYLVDRWDGQTYRRVLMVYEQPLEVAVTQTGPVEAPLLRVELDNSQPHWEWASVVADLLIKMLGLHLDLAPFYRRAEQDDRLRPLVQRWRGLKLPRFSSVFEALVNAITCQQLSLTRGIDLLNRLAATYGPALPGEGESWPGFPRPSDLADLAPEALQDLGFSRKKGTALIELARCFRNCRPNLENVGYPGKAEAMARLRAFKGVGRWSAEYVLLRGLGFWSVFPADDVRARRSLQAWLQLSEPPDYQEVRRHLAGWHPFGGLIYFHLLMNRLAEEGHLS